MDSLKQLADEVGADQRTLRRAVAQGTLRARRPGPRRLRLEPGEREYLRAHWPLLAELRHALRTERNVRLAVLYGSVARGDEDAGSDLDLLVDLADRSPGATAGLTARLGARLDRRVDLAILTRVEATAPLLVERVLDEGRVLVDRDGRWDGLCSRRRAIAARARRSHRRQIAAAAQAIQGTASETAIGP